LFLIELGEIDVEVEAGEFMLEPFVVEDTVLAEFIGQYAGDGFDALAVDTGKGQRDSETSPLGIGSHDIAKLSQGGGVGTMFVAQVKKLFLARRCVRAVFTAADEQFALRMRQQGFSIIEHY
jgi:hypothetical protein